MHDLHVWSITSGKASLTVHVVQRADVTDPQALLLAIRQLVAASTTSITARSRSRRRLASRQSRSTPSVQQQVMTMPSMRSTPATMSMKEKSDD